MSASCAGVAINGHPMGMSAAQKQASALKAQAKRDGSKFYCTGAPCKRGHIEKRYVATGHCIACAVDHQKEWWGQFPKEYKTARWRDWSAENREHRNAYKRLHGHGCKPETKRKWAKANPEKLKANYRRYYQKNKEYYKSTWRNRDALRRAAHGSHTVADIRALDRAQHGKCVYCRIAFGKKYHVDHITPLSAGGANDRTNLQLLCPPCNLSKGAKHPLVFARQIGLLL